MSLLWDLSVFSFSGLLVLAVILVRVSFLIRNSLCKKQVGPSYWGAYTGAPIEESPSMKTVDLNKHILKRSPLSEAQSTLVVNP